MASSVSYPPALQRNGARNSFILVCNEPVSAPQLRSPSSSTSSCTAPAGRRSRVGGGHRPPPPWPICISIISSPQHVDTLPRRENLARSARPSSSSCAKPPLPLHHHTATSQAVSQRTSPAPVPPLPLLCHPRRLEPWPTAFRARRPGRSHSTHLLTSLPSSLHQSPLSQPPASSPHGPKLKGRRSVRIRPRSQLARAPASMRVGAKERHNTGKRRRSAPVAV